MLSFLEYAQGKAIDKKLLDKIGKYRIFVVNASKIRDVSEKDDDFNHFGTHLEFEKLIPNNEIWVSKDISEHERPFLIHNGVNQYEAKEAGKRNWYDYALKKEKIEREKVDKIKFIGKKKMKEVPDKVYKEYYCGIPSPKDDIEVWLVNGNMVRDLFKTDFAEGGNSECYGFIPSGEIWIEKNLDEEEIDITILHEYIESTLMKYKKMKYNEAHVIAVKVDFKHRNKFSKEDVLGLSRELALEMVKDIK